MFPEKTLTNVVVKQDPRYRGSPEEDKDASAHTHLKLAQLKWTGHVTNCKAQELKQLEPKSRPQNQNGK